MQFLFPWFLLAAAAIAIPIIIHLYYFRRFRQVYFTNVRFLKEVKEETSSRARLRNLLVLIARCLTVLALVLAFAQPFIPLKKEVKQGEKAVSVYIDNSFSMSALSQDVPLIEKARQRAREIIGAYAPDDRFQVLTNDFEGRHLRLVSKDDALNLVEDIRISPASRPLSDVLRRQIQVLGTAGKDAKVAYLISDFQKNSTDLQQVKDTLTEINLVPLAAVQEKNISIDSCWFETPVQMLNQTARLLVRVRNYTAEPAENVRLALEHEGQTKPVGSLTIPPRSSTTDTVNITILRTGWHEAVLSLTDYPVQFDDKYCFSFQVAQDISVLSINETAPNRFLESAFAGAGYFKLTSVPGRSLDYSRFPGYKLIVLNELLTITSGLAAELRQYVEEGGNVLVFPSPKADLNAYRSFLNSLNANELAGFDNVKREVASVNTDEFVFREVFDNARTNLRLPSTQGNFRLNGTRGEEKLLTYRDGSAFVSKYKLGKGNLYLCTAPLDEQYNNLVRNGEIFVPMVYRMAISTAREQRIAYMIGRDESIEEDNFIVGGASGEKNYKLQGTAGEFIPQQRIIGAKLILGINDQIRQDGIYNLFLQRDSILAKYAFNFDRRESQLDCYGENDLKQFKRNNIHLLDATAEANFTSVVNDRSQGVVLWRWCLIFALLCLAAEVALLRFWKV